MVKPPKPRNTVPLKGYPSHRVKLRGLYQHRAVFNFFLLDSLEQFISPRGPTLGLHPGPQSATLSTRWVSYPLHKLYPLSSTLYPLVITPTLSKLPTTSFPTPSEKALRAMGKSDLGRVFVAAQDDKSASPEVVEGKKEVKSEDR